MVTITVSDTGTGMTREVVTSIFDRDYSTKSAKGNRLGLANVLPAEASPHPARIPKIGLIDATVGST